MGASDTREKVVVKAVGFLDEEMSYLRVPCHGGIKEMKKGKMTWGEGVVKKKSEGRRKIALIELNFELSKYLKCAFLNKKRLGYF